MMKQLFASHAAGWMVLTTLLISSGHLAGCDTSAPSKRDGGAGPLPVIDSTKGSGKKSEGLKPTSVSDVKSRTTDESKDKTGEADSAQVEVKVAEIADAGVPVVKRLVIASEIKEREPIELTDAKIEEPVVAFVEFKNSEDQETDVVITFEHEGGQEVGFVELNVPGKSPRYRTWARTRNIKKPGEWTAVVKTKSGEELARKTFQVTG